MPASDVVQKRIAMDKAAHDLSKVQDGKNKAQADAGTDYQKALADIARTWDPQIAIAQSASDKAVDDYNKALEG